MVRSGILIFYRWLPRQNWDRRIHWEKQFTCCQGKGLKLNQPDSVETTSGSGITAILGGDRIHVGSRQFMESQQVDLSEGEPVLEELMRAGRTTALVRKPGSCGSYRDYGYHQGRFPRQYRA